MAINANKKSTQNKNTTDKDAQQRMHDNYAAMGRVGGNTTKENHDENYYHNLGEARKEQMAHSSSYTNQDEGKKEDK